jgi:23S rRNA (pseudouridine1915-N3)-methyltransferase
MKLTIAAVGRGGAGPEAALAADYLDRLAAPGRNIGLGPALIVEVEDRRPARNTAARMKREGELLAGHCPPGAVLIAIDERGQDLKSTDLADRLGRWRDEGRRDAVFLIGGADGLDPALRERADLVLSLGRATWPHMLVRVMLAEQLYRAVTILAGHPYHRA